MRVLVLSAARGIPLRGPTGASAHLRSVAEAFGTLGHEVTVAVPCLTDQRGAHGRPPTYEVHTLPPPPPTGSRRQREGRERHHSRALVDSVPGPFDVLWERHSLHADGGWRWARRHGVPRLLELNAPLALERETTDPISGRALARRLERDSLRHADHVFAVSRWLLPWARALGARQVHHLLQATSHPRLGDRARARRRLGLKGLVIGFVGSHRPWHGLADLPALLDQLPEATAVVVGQGDAPPPPHPRLLALPHQPDLADVIAAFDVALAPGDAPPWVAPLKLMDYRAQGVPIVASDHGDARQLVGRSGEVLPVHATPTAWAEAIRRQAGRRSPPSPRSWPTAIAEALDRAGLSRG